MGRGRMVATVVGLAMLGVMGCGEGEAVDDGVTDVSFDGTTCTVEPGTAPTGDRAFILTNTSDVPLDAN